MPLCVIVADDGPMANAVIWSLPVELIDGYVLLGGPALGQWRRLPGCRACITVDLGDRLSALAMLDEVVSRSHPAPIMVLAADDAGCDLLADTVIKGMTTVPVASGQALHQLRDKWSFQQLCDSLGLSTPATDRVAAKADIDIHHLLDRHGGAVVIKPTDRKGGEGVVVIRSAADFQRRVLDDPTYDYGPLIVQAFVAGADLDISLLARSGKVLHYAIQTPEGRSMRFVPHAALAEAAAALVGAVGFSGLAHIDALWRPDGGVTLLECNARPWASLSKATWCGLNFVRAAIQVAQGQPTREPPALVSGLAPRPDAWVLSTLARPGRWLALTTDQKRLLLGARSVFAVMSWRDRWDRLVGLFAAGNGR